MPPRRTDRFDLVDLGAFDAVALRELVGAGGVPAAVLGTATIGAPRALTARLAAALTPARTQLFEAARAAAATGSEVAAARRRVVRALFWPLLYWLQPAVYEELVAGEEVHPTILESLAVEGLAVCDVGAGCGRFTLFAAPRASWVVAVDLALPMLARLRDRVDEAGFENVELRRGSFRRLPLEDDSVDLAVSCSAITSRGPWGGLAAVREMERVVRPGGRIAVVWPDSPEWFVARGFRHVTATGNATVRFADAAAAERLCREFYPAAAAQWVAAHRCRDVPYAVLGVRPPNDLCIREVPGRRIG